MAQIAAVMLDMLLEASLQACPRVCPRMAQEGRPAPGGDLVRGGHTTTCEDPYVWR